MRNKGINLALNQLIDERRNQSAGEDLFAPHKPESDSSQPHDHYFTLDISRYKTMSGLNILAESLIKAIIEHSVFARSDVLIEQRVDADLQPELHSIGVTNLCFYTRLSVLENLPQFYDTIGYQLRYMLNAIQINEIYSVLFPADGKSQRGALFPFHREDGSDVTGFFYLIEYVPGGRFLRITLESKQDSRLRMTRIPHLPINRIDLIHTRVDIPSTAAIIAQGLTEACIRQSRDYSATDVQIDDYLHFLYKAGLPGLEVMAFSWPTAFSRLALSAAGKQLEKRIMRVLLALGDTRLIARLLNGQPIRLEDTDCCVYLDLSQRNRCLTISMMEPRSRTGLSDYLCRMPAVEKTAHKNPDIFKNTRIIFIHHLTRETLGFIQAMIDMGAESMETLWVKYAGTVEPEFKEIILSLPEIIYRFRGLTPIIQEDGLQNRFLLSEQYSSITDLAELADLLREKPYHFFEAMRLVAGHLFFRMALTCRREHQQFIVIEDGGYISTSINRLCLENRSLRTAAELVEFPITQLSEQDLTQPFREWIAPVFIGSVEHTRNGFDALRKTENEFGKLAFPTVTIAISNFKSNIESRDVVYSCLNSVENIMTGMGFALSERTALVLGAQGTIGRKLMNVLGQRVGNKNLYGVDIVFPPEPPEWIWAPEPSALLSKAMQTIDFVFGVTGVSLCKADWIEQLIVTTEKHHLFFASGSTKTAEFSDLTDWLSVRMIDPSPTIDGMPLSLAISEIHDPKTGAHQGRSIQFTFGEKTLSFHLLADLMPANFLYYGVPSETMNQVMNELLLISTALVRRHKEQCPLPAGLLALDHQITFNGELISG